MAKNTVKPAGTHSSDGSMNKVLLCFELFFSAIMLKCLHSLVMFVRNVHELDDAGHYSEWDEDHPIHFLGHSAGVQVVRLLQQMLADKVGPILILLCKLHN